MTGCVCYDRLQGELEKIAPARKRPAKKTATSAYAFYVQEQFSTHRKAGMDTKDVSHRRVSQLGSSLQMTSPRMPCSHKLCSQACSLVHANLMLGP